MLADKRRLCLYGALPFAVGLLFVALYFSGVELLQAIASPASEREFGLIENTQNLVLLAAVVLCWRAGMRETERGWRLFLRLAALACFVLFMEEIDWGDHYWSVLTGSERPAGEHFNLHNRWDINRWLKKVVDVGFVVFFVLLPLGAKKLPARFRPLLPDLHSALTLLGGLLVSQIAHWLDDAGWTHNLSLHNNISEFREVFTYWLGLLYLWELTRRRRAEA
jgi:hypothetical protein